MYAKWSLIVSVADNRMAIIQIRKELQANHLFQWECYKHNYLECEKEKFKSLVSIILNKYAEKDSVKESEWKWVNVELSMNEGNENVLKDTDKWTAIYCSHSNTSNGKNQKIPKVNPLAMCVILCSCDSYIGS